MIRNTITLGLVGISVLLTLGALVFLSFWDTSEVIRNGNVEPATLLEDEGMDVLVLLILPVFLTTGTFAAALWLGGSKVSQVAIWTTGILLFVFGSMTIFSIGILYLPAALLLLIAAAVASIGAMQPENG